MVDLRVRLSEVIDQAEDQVLFADIGPVGGRASAAVSSLGRAYIKHDHKATVI
jgi:hypothetical protein